MAKRKIKTDKIPDGDFYRVWFEYSVFQPGISIRIDPLTLYKVTKTHYHFMLKDEDWKLNPIHKDELHHKRFSSFRESMDFKKCFWICDSMEMANYLIKQETEYVYNEIRRKMKYFRTSLPQLKRLSENGRILGGSFV